MATTWIFNSKSDSGHKPAIGGQLANASENILCLRNPWITDSVFMGKLYCAITVISLVGFYPQILPITLDLYNKNAALMLLFLISPLPFVPFLIYRIYFIKNLSNFFLNRSTQKIYYQRLSKVLGKLRTSCPSAGNGRLGDAEKTDFQPQIIGKPRHSLGFLPSRAHLSCRRQ